MTMAVTIVLNVHRARREGWQAHGGDGLRDTAAAIGLLAALGCSSTS